MGVRWQMKKVWQAVGAFSVWRHYVSDCGSPPSTLPIHAETKRVYSQTRERKQSNATSRGLEAVRSPAYDDNRNRETPVQKMQTAFFPAVRPTGRLRTISQRLTLVYGKFRHNPLFSIPRLTRSTPPLFDYTNDYTRARFRSLINTLSVKIPHANS